VLDHLREDLGVGLDRTHDGRKAAVGDSLEHRFQQVFSGRADSHAALEMLAQLILLIEGRQRGARADLADGL
jgi:hypothetical protein